MNASREVTRLAKSKSKDPIHDLPQPQKIGTLYDKFFSQTPWYLNVNEHLLDLAGVRSTDMVVDLCCGTGTSTVAIAKRVSDGRVIGVDSDQEMLSIASKKFTNTSNVLLLDGNVLELGKVLQGKVDKVDRVLLLNGIHYFKDKESLIHQASQLFEPGGTFGFNTGFYHGSTEPGMDFYGPFIRGVVRILKDEYSELKARAISKDDRATPITPGGYQEMLSSAGFDVTSEIKPVDIPRDSVAEFYSLPGVGFGMLSGVPEHIRNDIISKACRQVLDEKNLKKVTQNWLYMVGKKR